jgi:hypothetical protein
MSLEELTEDQRNSLALKKLFNHPELGIEAKRLYKKVVPDARFQDVEVADRIEAERAATQKEINDLRDQVRMQDVMRRRDEEHAKARAAGFDPVEVEKVITEEKIGSFDAAIKYLGAMRQTARPTPANITPITMPDDVANIQKDPRGWSAKTAHEAINELISQRRA